MEECTSSCTQWVSFVFGNHRHGPDKSPSCLRRVLGSGQLRPEELNASAQCPPQGKPTAHQQGRRPPQLPRAEVQGTWVRTIRTEGPLEGGGELPHKQRIRAGGEWKQPPSIPPSIGPQRCLSISACSRPQTLRLSPPGPHGEPGTHPTFSLTYNCHCSLRLPVR